MQPVTIDRTLLVELGNGMSAGPCNPRQRYLILGFGQVKLRGNDRREDKAARVYFCFACEDDGRFVVRGSKGREHIIEANGEHVTSIRRPDAAHQARLRDGTIGLAADEAFQRLKAFIE